MYTTSGKFANSEKFPSPWSGYGCGETPDLSMSAPIQGIAISESSQLSSVSQLRLLTIGQELWLLQAR